MQKKIWIDLDNSPHVPFFKPIIGKLQEAGYILFITARDSYQVYNLADFMKIEYKKVGRHYGKNKFMKLYGFLHRGIQLLPLALREKPDLALSHGSRSQILVSSILGITSIAISDYEHTAEVVSPTWALVPDIMHKEKIKHFKKGILTYPGIKEDVYVPYFQPNPKILQELGVHTESLLIVIRPPAVEAHYHTAESESLFLKTIDFLGNIENVCMILVPRNDRQKLLVKNTWPDLYKRKKIIIPEQVVDGLNLMWYADVVISGGGTMNREAAALGVPVYSIFRGKLGAVDKYLVDCGRLTLLENEEGLKNVLKIPKRNRSEDTILRNNLALTSIISNVTKVLENVF
ncbi:MAG: DUF354 domain-containing protein [Proteobacteria bacterium]|nr:DUF354 domain-containing protein [Pseudomonadota bacterium]